MRPLKEILDTIRARNEGDDWLRKQDGDGFLGFVGLIHFDGSEFYSLGECEGCLRETTRLAEKHADEQVRELAAGLIHYKDSNKGE